MKSRFICVVAGALAIATAMTAGESEARIRVRVRGGIGRRGFVGGRVVYRGGGYRGGYYGGRGYGFGPFLLGYGLGRVGGYRGYGYGYPAYGYNNYPSYGYGSPTYTNSYGTSGAVTTNGSSTNTVVPNQLPEAQNAGSGGTVQIAYPASSGPVVHYSLNGADQALNPGKIQSFPNDRRWIVQFDRGGGFGSARYTLSDGLYKFKTTDHGWELVRAASNALGPETEIHQRSPVEAPPSPKL